MDWVLLTLFEAAWAPIVILQFYFVARGMRLFGYLPSLDRPTHLIGGIAIAYFFGVAIHHSQKLTGKIPAPIQSLLAFTCAGTTMIFWEFYENISDYMLHARTVRGLEDTISDLFFGLAGALVLSLFYRKR